jgi:hypothetical protein
MAEPKAPSASYLPGNDPEAIEANRRYQEALTLLNQSLDTRKNRLFDPVLLAMAQGFGAPTQTGGFGESFSNAAKSVSAAEEAEIKREQEIAQQRVAVAGQGVELQRMKQRDAALENFLNPQPPAGSLAGPQAGAIAGPQAGPLSSVASAAPALKGAPPASALDQASAPKAAVAPQSGLAALEASKPPGFENIEGIQVMPPNPDFMTARDYIRLNRTDRSKSAADLIKEAQEVNQKRYRDKEGGIQDLATGKFFQFPTGKTEEITIDGYPGTHKVDARIAARLGWLALNDDPAYHDLAKRVMSGPRKKEAPKEGDQAAPTLRKSLQEMAVEQKEAEARAGELGKEAAKKEAAVEETDAAARNMFGGASRVLNYLKESPNFYGIFERPNLTAAVLGAINAGIKTSDGTISIGDLENAVTKLLPNVKQKDLDNVKKAAAELAEMELTYTKLFLSNQGAITEGERKIVRVIPGTISSSPEVLRSRMELIRMRTQKDMDVADAYRQWQDQNPGRSYFEFERKSQLYKDIKKNYEADLGKMFDTIKAIPTRERKQEAAPAATAKPPATPAAGEVQPSTGFIRDPSTGVIRKKKEGE